MAGLGSQHLKLVDNQEFADLVFAVGEEETQIFGHRLLLNKCDFFNKMFTGGFAESKSAAGDSKDSLDSRIKVPLPDADPEAFRCVLEWLYGPSTDKITAHNVVAVLTLADQYCIPDQCL